MFNPTGNIQDHLVFGEFGDVNPSITDSSTYTFLNPEKMKEIFEHEIEGCFLYSRHWNPTNKYFSQALASLEGSESAQVTASGMSAISCSVLQICSAGDEIISSRTVYGGTYALFKNFLPKLGIKVKFVNIQDLNAVASAITPNTKIIYTEAVSNPLLEVADIPALAAMSNKHNIRLIVDNTFSPLSIAPIQLGAHVVIHSLTKFINGTSDCVAGAICADKKFIDHLTDVNSGATMLLGPVLDSIRASSILKNLHSLHIRIQKHSYNAQYIAERLEKNGLKVFYPGLASHPQHELMKKIMNKDFGFGGMVAIDAGTEEKANQFMAKMQENKVGYLAVSLGYFKTLFSLPGNSTSSEIPKDEQKAMGMSPGLVRLSVGLDHDVERSLNRILDSWKSIG